VMPTPALGQVYIDSKTSSCHCVAGRSESEWVSDGSERNRPDCSGTSHDAVKDWRRQEGETLFGVNRDIC
jgi:hypothetical protein